MNKIKVMRKIRQGVEFDPDKCCNYCGDPVPDGTGWYTRNKLLLCKNCKPTFIPTTLKKIRPTKVKMLESTA